MAKNRSAYKLKIFLSGGCLWCWQFKVLDESDLLGYYLKRNLRFDDIIEGQYDQLSGLLLESMMQEYNKYYQY